MLDHTQPTPPSSDRACFVGSTAISTTMGRLRIDDLARLSAERDTATASYTAHLAAFDDTLTQALVVFDGSASRMLDLFPGDDAAKLLAALTAQREALVVTHARESGEKQSYFSDMLAAMLPRVLTRDPDTGELVERAIVKVWQASTATALVDVVIGTVSVEDGNTIREAQVKVRCTPAHVFIGPDAETPAKDLAGTKVYRLTGEGFEAWEVSSVQAYEAPDPVAVYDIEVEGIAAYCVSPHDNCGAVLVHNSKHETCPHCNGQKGEFEPSMAHTDFWVDCTYCEGSGSLRSQPKASLPVDRVFSKTTTAYSWRDVVDPATQAEVSFIAPTAWSDQAVTILATKYARKTGVPVGAEPWTHELDDRVTLNGPLGAETDARQIFGRLAGCWAHWGLKLGYFDAKNAGAFRAELTAMLEQQVAAPNSPQWFNTGLNWAYGITGPAKGHYAAAWVINTEALSEGRIGFSKGVDACTDSYTHPQAHACFIQSVEDDLVGENGIMDLIHREARLFKYGSGSGTNFSNIRGKGEKLSGGGTSSGLLSFLRIGDRAAGAIKSGGTTRRAAKMVIVDVDHPDIEEFITWKSREKRKIQALRAAGIGDPTDFEDEATNTVSGQNGNNSVRLTDAFMQAVANGESFDLIARTTGEVMKTVDARELWGKLCEAAWDCADPGVQFHDTINKWNTCAGDESIKGSNPCCLYKGTLVAAAKGYVAIDALAQIASDELPEVLCYDGTKWTARQCLRAWQSGVSGAVLTVLTSAGHELRCTPEHRFMLASGAYVEAQKLVQGMELQTPEGVCIVADTSLETRYAVSDTEPVYDIEVEALHNFGVSSDAKLPPVAVHNSEYMWLDDTACNLASLNLVKFLNDDGSFDHDSYRHAVRLWTIVLDITVSMAGYPSERIAARSQEYRTLGLGYANLGGLLMRTGIPYDSDEGRRAGEDLTSRMGAFSWQTSAELAGHLGAFPAYERNTSHVIRVLDQHWKAAPTATRDAWNIAVCEVSKHGARNAQCTLLAPTGTISFVMDCDTTGVEPDFALVKLKRLAGGGYFKLVNMAMSEGLHSIGYNNEQVHDITLHCKGRGSLVDAPALSTVLLGDNGFTASMLLEIKKGLRSAMHIRDVFNVETLGVDECVEAFGLTERERAADDFDLLTALGFTREQVRIANHHACGTGNVKHAPHLRAEHVAIFDCANDIDWQGHLGMMAAAQPFLCGAISKTINMPSTATPEDISACYTQAHALGLKAVAVYRDKSKATQVLTTEDDEPETEQPSFTIRDSDSLTFNDGAGTQTIAGVQLCREVGALARGQREAPPALRDGKTARLKIAGESHYVTANRYADGRLCELFIVVGKAGGTVAGWADAFACTASLYLQSGGDLAHLISKLRFHRFEPAGFVTDGPCGIRSANSPVDGIAQLLECLSQAAEEPASTLPPAKLTVALETPESAPKRQATGAVCSLCRSTNLQAAGTCLVCRDCGATTGCG